VHVALPGQFVATLPGGKTDQFKFAGMLRNDVQRITTDRTGRAQYHDTSHVLLTVNIATY
jgi:hypothetical protein